MITQPELERFYALRQYVFDNIKHELPIDSPCKSYEGAMAIHFPTTSMAAHPIAGPPH